MLIPKKASKGSNMSVRRLSNGRQGNSEDDLMDDHELINNLHADMKQLTKAVDKLSETIQPVADNMPALLELARAWNTAKATTRAAQIAASVLKWTASIVVALVVIYLVVHGDWERLGEFKL